MSFHNTTGQAGQELADKVLKAKSQDAAMLMVFKAKRDSKFTAWQLHDSYRARAAEKGLPCPPITSFRRALSNLKKNDDLIKLEERRRGGPYNEEEHYYALNKRKHPTETGVKQQGLF